VTGEMSRTELIAKSKPHLNGWKHMHEQLDQSLIACSRRSKIRYITISTSSLA